MIRICEKCRTPLIVLDNGSEECPSCNQGDSLVPPVIYNRSQDPESAVADSAISEQTPEQESRLSNSLPPPVRGSKVPATPSSGDSAVLPPSAVPPIVGQSQQQERLTGETTSQPAAANIDPVVHPQGTDKESRNLDSKRRKKKSRTKKKSKSSGDQTDPPVVDQLLPPRQSKVKEVAESLLPLAAKPSGEGDDAPVAASEQPPIQKGDTLPTSGDDVPQTARGPVNSELIAESEKVFLPDGEGGLIEVSERKTHVHYRGALIELDRLKREEKDVKRGWRDFLVAIVCVFFLVVLMIILSWYNSPSGA